MEQLEKLASEKGMAAYNLLTFYQIGFDHTDDEYVKKAALKLSEWNRQYDDLLKSTENSQDIL